MDTGSRTLGKIRRQEVHIFMTDGREFVHPICDIAMPTPDGNYFLVRDLTKGEKANQKASSCDAFYPTVMIDRIAIFSHQYNVLADGSRGEEVLDKPGELVEIKG